ncbi:AMP-binding protein [Nocardioides sp. zg-536]|uniref:Acyl-CoA synthetase n=1 Tax=Nocardioides faecalis TaxID=2803858 RepID=A0A938Y5Y3_9ACTN|nr:AMP-binding protein [Nocardioides faecalis]MBM9458490.1 AMP-binding protein [Nocardioides faecalis]MBS4752821.1 AMP-binding protein [Nocardioides faecalis]QVI58502.1 AMP-binding protein [Nocardioides faecalis]
MTRTLVTRIRDRASATPDRVAMREKRLGLWHEITWAQYWDSILDVAHALLALDVRPTDRVGVQSENRPEWLILDMAAVAVRATTVGLYPTNPTAETSYLLSHSGACVHLAEDQEQVDKVLEAGDLPDLRRIVYVEPRGLRTYDDPRLLSWEELVAMGRAHRAAHPGAVEALVAAAEPSDVITLVYTSGTTGPPKGAMLTVANAEFALETVLERSPLTDPIPGPKDLTLSYLPLCHVAERVLTTWYNAGAGTQVNFAESIETVPQNLREVQPTLFFAVPRIWEKLLATTRIKLDSATPLKRRYAAFWMRRADRLGATLAANDGRHTAGTRVVYAIGWLLFFRALRERLGLRRVRHASCGAAPVAPEVLQFFMGIGVAMHELYGMTENTAIATCNRVGRVRLGTVGEVHDGIELRLDETTGEILTRHAANFVGYWRDPDATARTLSAEGWLHTGDVGEWVEGTHLRITDRMKDIIITAGGKNVAPSEIENGLKASPYIKEAVVIGDGRRYLTALIGIELDTVGAWAQQRRLGFTTYRDLAEKEEVRALVQGVVDEVNARHNPVEQIKHFRMLPKELDHEDGELTATQKVKRAAIDRAFGDLVESMYATERTPS